MSTSRTWLDVRRLSPTTGRGIAERLQHHMRDIPFAGDRFVPLRPVVLPPGAAARISSATRQLVRIVEQAAWSLASTPDVLARRTRVDAQKVPFLAHAEPAQERELAASNVRADATLVQGVPKFFELNYGAANTFPVASHFMRRALGEVYGAGPQHLGGADEPFALRLRLYERIISDHGLDAKVAIIGSLQEELINDSRYFDAEVEYLRDNGLESFFVDPATQRVDMRGTGIALKHFIPEEWIQMGIPLGPLVQAQADTVFIVPDSGLSLSSKLLLAWLSEGRFDLSPGDQTVVDRHVPWTREITASTEGTGLLRQTLDRQEDLVIKPVTEFGGAGVTVGRHVSRSAWSRAVIDAGRAGGHVVQKYMHGDSLTMDYFDLKENRVLRSQVSYVLGPHVIGGQDAGCSARIVPRNVGVVNGSAGADLVMVV